jgi:hypothetical protein
MFYPVYCPRCGADCYVVLADVPCSDQVERWVTEQSCACALTAAEIASVLASTQETDPITEVL